MSSSSVDPLYRPCGDLPDGAVEHDFAGMRAGVSVVDTPPDVVAAMWMPDRAVTLHLPDPVDAAALERALPAFLEYAASLADRPTGAQLTLPSRDLDACRVARAAGLAPESILAACSPIPALPSAAGSSGSAVHVRSARPDDADRVAELWWEQACYERRVGVLRATDAIHEAIIAAAPHALSGEGIALVAELDDELVGTVLAESPQASGWAGGRLAAPSLSYLAMASTTEAARGRGVAAALVAQLHSRHRAASVAAGVLHYSAYNPLSVPFWSRQGYRPLLTSLGLALGANHPCPLT